MARNGDTREQGIEFGDLDSQLNTVKWPISPEDLLDQFGSHEISYADETRTLEDIFDQGDDEQFHDPEEVKTAIKNRVGVEAVGRKNYSDRGTGGDIGARRDADESF